MKKFLLTLACLLSFGSIALADDVKSFEPTTEYKTINELQEAGKFSIVNKADGKALFGSNAQNLAYDVYTKAYVSTNSGYMWRLDDAGGDGYYLQLIDSKGLDYNCWGMGGVLNSQGEPQGWGCSFILGKSDKRGQDIKDGAVWKLEYNTEKGGWTLFNLGTEMYQVAGNGPANSTDPVYFQFCKVEEVTITNPIEKGTYDATDAKLLRSSGVTNSNVTLSWTEGIDLGAYQYIVINMGQNTMENGDTGELYIVDGNGTRIAGDAYGEAYQNMWFGSWNHQYTCCIDLEKLRIDHMFNIHDIRELCVPIKDNASVIVNTIYATNVKANTVNRWNNPNDEGTYRVLEDKLEAGKYGTVCLPYEASYSGVSIYEIAGLTEEGIELSEVTGLMEAGKAYFYQVNEPLNPTSADTKIRAFFYQATAATVTEPKASNGLVGTFAATNAPMDSYVLSNNKFYKVDSDVNVAANKAYLDIDEISTNNAGVKAIAFENATAIKNIEKALNSDKIYDMNGREVKSIQKGGMYIMGGMKVLVK